MIERLRGKADSLYALEGSSPEEPYEWNPSSTGLWGGRRVTGAFTRNFAEYAPTIPQI